MATLALHTLVVRLHSTDGTIQWVTTGNLLAMAVAIPVTGWAESRWGGKRAWMAALVLLVAGSVLCALSWSDVSLVGSRVLQGFAAGLIFPLLAGIALLGAFSAWTLRASNRQPIVDVRLLRLRSLGTASTVLFTAGAAMYAGMFLLPLYYQQLHGETVLHAGLLLIPQGVGSLAARFAVGKLTVRHRGAADSRAIPDTGTLRSDLLALLTEANTDRNPMAALVSTCSAAITTRLVPLPELRNEFRGQRGSAVEEIVNRAVERGEVDSARLTPRIIDLPFDLFRHEMMMTLKPVPYHVLRQIVDDIFIPLVTTQPGIGLSPRPPGRP
jgi:Tetracyclin repressor-like, C-terminal domain/Major Facilitator Superfamily